MQLAAACLALIAAQEPTHNATTVGGYGEISTTRILAAATLQPR